MKKKIIVVGGGRWGTNHIKTLIQLDSFYAVVEPDEKNRDKLREQFSEIVIYNNLEDSFQANADGYIVNAIYQTCNFFWKLWQYNKFYVANENV